MCSLTLRSPVSPSSSRPPTHIAFAPSPPSSKLTPPSPTSPSPPLLFATLYPRTPSRPARVELHNWALPLSGSAQANARAGLPQPELRWCVELPEEGLRSVRQCAVRAEGEVVAVLGEGEAGEGEVLLLVGEEGVRRTVRVREGARRLVVMQQGERSEGDEEDGEGAFLLETREGEILEGAVCLLPPASSRGHC